MNPGYLAAAISNAVRRRRRPTPPPTYRAGGVVNPPASVVYLGSGLNGPFRRLLDDQRRIEEELQRLAMIVPATLLPWAKDEVDRRTDTIDALQKARPQRPTDHPRLIALRSVQRDFTYGDLP